ncbi:hypothetical protein QQS21_002079 [Conoideocrella luteorostrata]|uniref:Phenol 2-monooxygenase n=1 Tax=Conoideocrella luteorostrata TaxID=1105319 RepID=A0AAJ0CYR4_9HYPO|nr:hypothetical protein QQS21_002079 [Conoideocrella luteorostrata]
MSTEPVPNSLEAVGRKASGVNGQHNEHLDVPEGKSDVCIVGGGPAGLMLSTVLARLGLKIRVLDDRPEQTAVGRADGIQPKTIETLQMLGLADGLLRRGVKVFDICMWRGSRSHDLRRVDREVHYPASIVDVLHPFILLCHQGMVEDVFVEDLRQSGVEVSRSHSFQKFQQSGDDSAGALHIECLVSNREKKTVTSDYIVGCDGARSLVRQHIPGTYSQGTPHNSVWGVLDGELDTDFPDIWSKTVVYSEDYGSILMIPRERNMTRLYVEMKTRTDSKSLGQEFVMDQARRILAPYRVAWVFIEWFGNYQVSQRVAAHFSDPTLKAFIAGDASHTHSPKAAQGMNTSVHDSWNLGWKLNLAVRGLAKGNTLLESYEMERKKIAHDLINFDVEHANEVATGDPVRLADNFRINTRFISGVGVEYGENDINRVQSFGRLRPGCNLLPARATRYIDSNPVDIQLDIPMLGQFRLYALVPDVTDAKQALYLETLSNKVLSPSSFISRISEKASQSYAGKPRARRQENQFVRPERYTKTSELFTFSLITSTSQTAFEIGSLPTLFSSSPWTVYVDDVASCIEKWLGPLEAGDMAIVNVRPDGYVGSLEKWNSADEKAGVRAAEFLDDYYSRFLAT